MMKKLLLTASCIWLAASFTAKAQTGESLSFDGVDDYVQVAPAVMSQFDTLRTFTVEAWVYPTTTTGLGVIIGDYATGNSSQMHFLLRRDGDTYTFWTGTYWGAFYSISAPAGTVQLNTWQHISATWDGYLSRQYLYINGVQQASDYCDYSMPVTSNQLWIGNNALNEAFQGKIDEVRLWKRPLCTTEIPARMNGEANSNLPGLALNYHFNEGTAGQNNAGVTTLINDGPAGTSYDGTLTNFALNGASSNWVTPGAFAAGTPAGEPSSFPIHQILQPPTCYGGNDGDVLVYGVSGDTYTFDWTPDFGTLDGQPEIHNASAGTYTITMTNQCAKTETATVTLTQPDPITISAAITNVTCNGGNDGAVTFSATGGGQPNYSYQYLWNGGYYDDSTFTQLPAATYTVEVHRGMCVGTHTVVITQPAPLTSTVTVSGCNSVTAAGSTMYNSGTYLFWLTSVNGCDSAVTVNATVTHSSSSAFSATACSQYLFNGVTYTTSGLYNDTLTNAMGCDSIITLDLTILNSSSTLNMTNCGAYTLNGTTYNASGTYIQTLTNAAGCDSTITLNLVVASPSSSILYATACSNYTLNGTTYATSGIYTQTLGNAAGCDSTITLNLTLNQPSTGPVLTETACSYYTLNGTTYTASGTYTQTLANAAGCDSVITLNLTINTVDVGVTQNGGTFTANAAGLSYQWVDCDSGNQPLNGQTNQSFTPQYNGLYAVIVSDGICTAMSNCLYINNVGLLNNKSATLELNIFPNPNNGEFSIKGSSEGTYYLVSELGQQISLIALTAKNNYSAKVEELSGGVYFLIGKENGSHTKIVVTD